MQYALDTFGLTPSSTGDGWIGAVGTLWFQVQQLNDRNDALNRMLNDAASKIQQLESAREGGGGQSGGGPREREPISNQKN